ncbi:serine/threonine protein kinase, partial [Frankia sp. AiPs1]|nr:serine/threonine protein kinase [Frankia sp. AiPs1]
GPDLATATGEAGSAAATAAEVNAGSGSAPTATIREVDHPAPAQQSGPAATPASGTGAATTTPSATTAAAAATATAKRIAAAFTTGSAAGRTTSTCLPGGPWGPVQLAAGCGGALILPAVLRAPTAPPPWSTALAEGIPRLIAAAVSSEAPWDELG